MRLRWTVRLGLGGEERGIGTYEDAAGWCWEDVAYALGDYRHCGLVGRGVFELVPLFSYW